MKSLKWNVDQRAVKYYIDRTNGRAYIEGRKPKDIDTSLLLRKWNAMVETGFKTGQAFQTKRNKDEYKVYVGKMKFTVNTKTMCIRYVDCIDFINKYGECDINNNKIKIGLDIATVLKDTYLMFGLNSLGNKIIA